MIAFVCIADEKYAKKYSKYIQSQKKYCEDNNYTYFLKGDNKYIETKEDWYWKKVFEVRDTLKQSSYDYVVLIDADCEITNKAKPIETELDNSSIYYVLGISKRPNSGFMIFKNDNRSLSFIDDVIDKRYKQEPIEHRVMGFDDNTKIIWSLAEDNTKTKTLDLKWNCTQPEFINEAYIIHYTNKMKNR